MGPLVGHFSFRKHGLLDLCTDHGAEWTLSCGDSQRSWLYTASIFDMVDFCRKLSASVVLRPWKMAVPLDFHYLRHGLSCLSQNDMF